MWTPYIYLQLLKLVTSNVVHNLGSLNWKSLEVPLEQGNFGLIGVSKYYYYKFR